MNNPFSTPRCLLWRFSCLQSLPSLVHRELKYSHFKCAPGTSNISIAPELVRNAEGQAPSWTYGVRICILTRCPGDVQARRVACLRSTGQNHMADVTLLPRHSTFGDSLCGLTETIQTQQSHPRLPTQCLLSESPRFQPSQAQQSPTLYVPFPLQECLSINGEITLNLQNQAQTSSRKPSGTPPPHTRRHCPFL